MSASDVVEGYLSITPADFDHPNTTPARIILNLIRFYPGAYAKNVKCPIFFGVCRKDTVAPAGATISYARQAPKGEVSKIDTGSSHAFESWAKTALFSFPNLFQVKIYEDMGHFDIYTGEKTQRARKDYVEFLKSHL